MLVVIPSFFALSLLYWDAGVGIFKDKAFLFQILSATINQCLIFTLAAYIILRIQARLYLQNELVKSQEKQLRYVLNEQTDGIMVTPRESDSMDEIQFTNKKVELIYNKQLSSMSKKEIDKLDLMNKKLFKKVHLEQKSSSTNVSGEKFNLKQIITS